MRADFIIANPPYNQKQYWKPYLEGDPRWLFGKPDTKNANYAWLLLMYAKLAPRGKDAILMRMEQQQAIQQTIINFERKCLKKARLRLS